jgi:hypothetical protein
LVFRWLVAASPWCCVSARRDTLACSVAQPSRLECGGLMACGHPPVVLCVCGKKSGPGVWFNNNLCGVG